MRPIVSKPESERFAIVTWGSGEEQALRPSRHQMNLSETRHSLPLIFWQGHLLGTIIQKMLLQKSRETMSKKKPFNIVLSIQGNVFLYSIFNSVKKVVKIVPYYLFEQTLTDETALHVTPNLRPLKICLLESSDMKALSSHPEVIESEKDLLERFTNGSICLALTHNETLVAYTWCELNHCRYFPAHDMALKKDEAYIYDARTFKAYRGKNIAPYLRYQLCRCLKKIMRTKIYNYTVAVNPSAVNYTKKLGAKAARLYLGIIFLGRYQFKMLLKNYEGQNRASVR